MAIQVHYHHAHNNFGDILTPYIVEKMSGEKPQRSQTGKHLILCGSILQDATGDSVVLGAGFGNKDQKTQGQASIKIIRGPITADILKKQGYKPRWVYGDPGMILPLLYAPDIKPIYDVGILPHYVDYELFEPAPNLIDITTGIENVVNAMLQCRSLVTSSLHGLIIGQAYNIPTTLEKWSNKIASKIKYDDYLQSIKYVNPQLVYDTIQEVLRWPIW